jgi:probable HAF family extracellular repeat protein
VRSINRRRFGAFSIILAATTTLVPVAASAATAAPPVATGRLVQLDSLGGAGSYGTAMNERGDIIGASHDAEGTYGAVVWWHGERSPTALGVEGARADAINEDGHIAGNADGGLFLWRAGTVTRQRPGTVASFSRVTINDRDQVAGTATGGDDVSRAFVWHHGRMTLLPTPDGASSRAVDINNAGQVVGTVTRPGASGEQPVLWQDGRMTELGTPGDAAGAPAAINERGQVIGNTDTGSPYDRPFLWQNGRTTDLLAGTDAATGRVTALNDAGMMTGYAGFGDHNSRPVVWRDGGLTVIGLPGHVGSGSFLNDRGDVVGPTWPDPENLSVPFRWRNGRTTLYPEPVADIAWTVIGIDRHGHIAVDQETSRQTNIVLRSV